LIANAEKDLVDMRMAYKTFFNSSDLRVPHEWYPLARIMRRKVIFHGGPTNSGKTYHALQRLKEADPAKGTHLLAHLLTHLSIYSLAHLH
jgi:ATP-dependent RNA helicase SUPV3L1/SUV3